MDVLKSLLYLGTDEELFKELQQYCKKYIRTEYQVENRSYSPGNIIKLVAKTSPNIVFVDFTSIISKERLFEEILFLKRYKRFKGILFVAILSDTSNKRDQLHLYSSGFQLGYVKGGEVENFVADSLYIGLGEKVPIPDFARARKIHKQMKVGICSTITRMSFDEFCVETDLEVDDEHVSLTLSMFPELEAETFEIKAHKEISLLYPMTDTLILKYPYPGPWDEITNSTIQKETVETWLDLYQEEFFRKGSFIKIVSNNINLCQELYDEMANTPLFIEACDSIDFEKINKELTLKNHPLMFLDLRDEDEGDETDEDRMELVSELIVNIKSLGGPQPILIVTNSPSKTEALQKAYSYINIIGSSDKLSIEMFKLFTKTFLEKGKFDKEPEHYYFKYSDTQRAIDVFHDIEVTSLTEHEITFFSKIDLPMFSVLHLTLPVNCFVTIVPPYFELSTSRNGKHYLGFIHGLSEEEIKNLRKFVNQIIYHPISEFSPEVVRALIEQKEIEKKDEKADKKAKETKKDDNINGNQTFKRPSVKGKSKL